MNLQQLHRRMVIHGAAVEGNANRLVRGIVLVIDQALVLSTPVDKGVARSNWLASVGSSRSDQIPAYAPGSKLGLAERANAEGAIRQAQGAMAARLPGQDCFITNNVPYIETLNNGYSAQAPPSFVQLAIQRGVEAVRANPGPLLRGVPLKGQP